MATLAQSLPHPYPGACIRWLCEWCDARGEADAHDLVPAICPECASARIWKDDLWWAQPDEDEPD
jgi:hypothetical protein